MQLTFHNLERNLGVKFPPTFHTALIAKPLSRHVSWETLPPTDWVWLSEHIGELPDGERALVIGDNGCGDYSCLKMRQGASPEFGEEIYLYSHESQSLELVGTTILEADQERALLSQANKILGDDLEIIDEEDTY